MRYLHTSVYTVKTVLIRRHSCIRPEYLARAAGLTSDPVLTTWPRKSLVLPSTCAPSDLDTANGRILAGLGSDPPPGSGRSYAPSRFVTPFPRSFHHCLPSPSVVPGIARRREMAHSLPTAPASLALSNAVGSSVLRAQTSTLSCLISHLTTSRRPVLAAT